MNILEFNTAGCVLVNGAYVASFNLLVETGSVPNVTRTRHYYGTLIPGDVPGGYQAVQHDAVEVLLETPELMSVALDLARQQAVDGLPTE